MCKFSLTTGILMTIEQHLLVKQIEEEFLVHFNRFEHQEAKIKSQTKLQN